LLCSKAEYHRFYFQPISIAARWPLDRRSIAADIIPVDKLDLAGSRRWNKRRCDLILAFHREVIPEPRRAGLWTGTSSICLPKSAVSTIRSLFSPPTFPRTILFVSPACRALQTFCSICLHRIVRGSKRSFSSRQCRDLRGARAAHPCRAFSCSARRAHTCAHLYLVRARAHGEAAQVTVRGHRC